MKRKRRFVAKRIVDMKH